MSITVGDVLKVVATLAFTDGELMQNVFSMVVGGTGGPFTDSDVVDDAIDWIDGIYAELVGYQSATCDGSQVQVYVYDPVDDDFDEVGSGSFVYDPASGGDPMPRGVAALINAKTSDPDVSGKKYFGGLTETSAVDGVWNSSLLTALAAAALEWGTQFVGATSGATFNPCVWSPTKTNAYVLSNDYIIPGEAAYQRRRKRGVGV